MEREEHIRPIRPEDRFHPLLQEVMRSVFFKDIYREAFQYNPINKEVKDDLVSKLSGGLFEHVSYVYLRGKKIHSEILTPVNSAHVIKGIIEGQKNFDNLVSYSFGTLGTNRVKNGYTPDGIRIDSQNRISLYEYTLKPQPERVHAKIQQAQWFKRYIQNNRPQYTDVSLSFVIPQSCWIHQRLRSEPVVHEVIPMPFSNRQFGEFITYVVDEYRQSPKTKTIADHYKNADDYREEIVSALV